jgi:glutathione S-transferase
MLERFAEVASSTLLSTLNLWRGTNAVPVASKPKMPLRLYDMEGSPFCRIVREALTELDLEALIYPCPKGGTRFRARVKKLGGKLQFPFLVDPNTGARLYESADIVAYLFKTYARRPLPLEWRAMPFQQASSALAGAARWGRGLRKRPSRAPKKPLELYSFESSPFSRLVRERLCELEIPYLLHNVGKREWVDYVLPKVRERLWPRRPFKGESRKALAKRAGKVMVPYLVDANTGREMFESETILAYLSDTYGA